MWCSSPFSIYSILFWNSTFKSPFYKSFIFHSLLFLTCNKFQVIPINAYEKLYNNQYLIVQQIDEAYSIRTIFFRHNLYWVRLFYPRLACRCAKEARAIGYSHFGLQFFAECWSDAQAKERYNRYGKSSVCTGFEYKTCNDKDENECVGGGNKNYVYEIVDKGKESKILKKLGYDKTKWNNKTRHHLDIGSASDWSHCVRICFIQSEAIPRFG